MSHPNLDFTKNLSLVELEHSILDYWDSIHAFERSVSERPTTKPYVFYDGPPFVTGSPHYGSILGSIAKDVIPRYWTMKGYRVERQWGWDCHGLPMEHMIEKELGLKGGKVGIEQLGIANFNDACRAAITRIDSTWDVIIRRIGRWVDFKKSYKTMDTSYMESVWWGFAQMYEKGYVYEGIKVILYCPRCSTPLSNFEIAMDNSYVDLTEPSTTYKFEVAPNTFLLAWSTTPWTKIGTMGLAVHPDLIYALVESGGEQLLLAESRLSELPQEYALTETFTGRELVKRYPHYTPHFDWAPLSPEEKQRAYRVVADPFVTADTGTGVVTLAVYGEDDYRVMKRENIPLYNYVDSQGFLDETIQETAWQGKSVVDPALNQAIDQALQERNLILKQEPHTHSIGTCYRCGTRLYYAPMPAWFIDIAKLRPQLLAENEKINWYPDHLKHGRFQKGIESAPDWNISRSRYWSTPMPVWRSDDGQHTRIIGSLAELTEWAVNPAQVQALTDIHREFVDPIEVWVDNEKTIKGKRIPEVFDVWVDSSSMPFASVHYPFENKEKFEAAYPAQFISEYINQTRAWFYTMHVLSVGLFGEPSFLNAHNTGIILAKDGSKMSKSKKNYTDPMELIEKEGADALRLYLMASPVTKAESVAFKDEDVSNMRKRVLTIWWNVFQFHQLYQPASSISAPVQPQHVMDRWILALLEELTQTVTSSMDTYDVTTAARSLIAFIDQLSTWYLRQSRDRLRQGDSDIQGWHTFTQVLLQLAQLAAPLVPLITEAMYAPLGGKLDSIHLDQWPASRPEWENSELLKEMSALRQVVELTHSQRKEANVPLRQPIASIAVVSSFEQPDEELCATLLSEVNAETLVWKQAAGSVTRVTPDFTPTPELLEKGEARKIVRTLQNLRKEAGVSVEALVVSTLPDWPESQAEYIRQKTKSRELVKGDWGISLSY